MRLKVSNVCQLLDKSKFPATKTDNGVTYTNNGDGTITVNGTATDNIYFNISGGQLVCTPNKKYLLCGCPTGGSWSTFNLYVSQGSDKGWLSDSADFGNGNVFTGVADATKFSGVVIFISKNQTVNNLVYKPQLFDLTEMYGAGNEPTTVEQFRQDFPNEMYDYSPECWKKFSRLKYIANKEPVQLLDKSKFKAGTSKNVTATPDITNGMWTISGAATASEYLGIGVCYPGTDFNIGDKLFLRNSNIDNSVYFPYATWYDNDNKYLGEYDGMGVFSVTNPEIAYIACYFVTRTVGDINVTTQVQLFNLTRMYGKGNEPTAAEFVAQYPGFDYPVNKYNYLTLRRGKYIANKEPVQLLDKSKYPATTTNKGITITNNGDGSITLNGTATSDGEFYSLQYINLINGHKYFIYDNQGGSFANVVFTLDALGSADNREGNIWTCNITSGPLRRNAYFYIVPGTVISNRVYKPQIFDLTEMFGAGNEPTTVEQFRADFPNELYDYNPYNAITFR